MTLYQCDSPPIEGKPYCYLGVYILKWQKKWGQPTVGFAEVDDQPVLPPAAASEPGPTVRDVEEVYGVQSRDPSESVATESTARAAATELMALSLAAPLPAAPSEREALLRLCVEWLREATPGTSLETTDLVDYLLEHGVRTGPLSERPECVEVLARALFRRRFPEGEWTPGAPATEQALEDVRELRGAERAAGEAAGG